MFTIHRLFECASQAVVFVPLPPPENQNIGAAASKPLQGVCAEQVVLVVLEQQPVWDLVKSQGCGKEQLVS